MIGYWGLKGDLHRPFLLGTMLSQALQQPTFSISSLLHGIVQKPFKLQSSTGSGCQRSISALTEDNLPS